MTTNTLIENMRVKLKTFSGINSSNRFKKFTAYSTKEQFLKYTDKRFPSNKTIPLLSMLILSACGPDENSDEAEAETIDMPNKNSDEAETVATDKLEENRQILDYSTYIYEVIGASYKEQKFGSFELIFVDLNHDGNDEILFQTWRGGDNETIAIEKPTEEYLIIYDFVSDDGPSVVNSEVISQNSLGGLSRRHAVGDLNGDGIKDLAFAMNLEDGRSASDLDKMVALPTILLSGEDGRFTIESFGVLDWGHSVETVPNLYGYDDVLFGGYLSGNENFRGLQAYRNQSGEWVDVTYSYPADPELKWANSISNLLIQGPDGLTNILAVTATRDTNVNGYYEVLEEGIKFYELGIDDEWSIKGEYWLQLSDTIKLTGWSGDLQTVQVGSYLGKNIIYPNFHEVVSVLDLNGKDYFIAKLSAMDLKEGEELDFNQTYQESGNEFSSYNTLLFFEVSQNGSVELVSSPILEEVTNVNYNFFDVVDINGDGFKDIVISAYSRPGFNELVESGGHPIVYLGSELGTFKKADISNLPKHSSYELGEGLELYGKFKDMNSDGYFDLVLTGTSEASVEVILLSDFI